MTDYYPYFKKNTFFKYLYYFTKERGVALSGNAGCAFKPRVPRYSSFHNRVTCLRERPTSVRCDCLHMKVSPCSLLARIFARPVPVFPIPAGTYLGLLSASPTHQPNRHYWGLSASPTHQLALFGIICAHQPAAWVTEHGDDGRGAREFALST